MRPKLIEKSLDSIQKTFKLVGVVTDEDLSACYLSYFLELVRARGLRTTIKHLGEIYKELMRFSCGLKIVVGTSMWLKRDKDNFPIKLKPFKKCLRQGSTQSRRYALSLLRVYESIELPPVPNLESVTTPSKGKDFYATSLEPSFKEFLRTSYFGKNLRTLYTKACAKVVYERMGGPFHFSTKRGIEGPTCLTAGKQSLAINDEMKKLLGAFDLKFREAPWIEMLEENQNFFRDRDDFYPTTSKSETFLGRITFVSDKGGKTRLVAIGNYWVQDVLLGLHKTLYKMLREVPTDGTYNQCKQSDRVKAQSGVGWCWSYDLSSATDRFPIQPQVDLLKHLDSEMGELWNNILNSLTFEYKGQSLKYAVGQPMGLYSSWAVFSLTHHAIIQYCAWVKRIPYPFSQYAVLGDDVAIWNKDVALKYREVISGLDVVINKAKSFEPLNESLNEPGIAEFAKRIYVKGEEITALSPGICNESWSSFYSIPEFLQYLSDHNFLAEETPLSRLVSILRLKTKQIDEFLCLLRVKECVGAPIKGVTADVPSNLDLSLITLESVTRARLELLAKQASDLWNDIFDHIEQIGQVLENDLVGPVPEYLYLRIIVDTRITDILELESKLIAFLPSEENDEDTDVAVDDVDQPLPPLSELEYLPSVDIKELKATLAGKPQRHRVHRGRYIQQLALQIRKG